MKATEYREYCDNLTFELAGLKEKIDHIVDRFDHLSTGEKERFVGEVNGLHIISSELTDRLMGLNTACEMNWMPQREEHDVSWPEQSEKTYARVYQSDFGG
jgi:hypothetical protein